MRIAMLADNDARVDSRIRREAEALVASGHETRVFCLQSDGAPQFERENGVDYSRISLPSTKEILLNKNSIARVMPSQSPPSRVADTCTSETSRKIGRVRRMIGNLIIFKAFERAYALAVNTFSPHIIHAHDLTTLQAGAFIAQKCKAQLIYDSHELEWDRNASYSIPTILYRRWLERRLIQKADHIITVSPSIARFLKNKYPITVPTIILNTPNMEQVHPSHRSIRDVMGLEKTEILGVYVGAVMPNRGLEQAIKTLPYLDNLTIACVGPGDASLQETLKDLAISLGVDERFKLLDPVPSNSVSTFIAEANFSLILIQDACLSYRYAYPNKLFESAFADLPIIAADLPDIAAFLEKFECGLTVNQTDPHSIAVGIRKVVTNQQHFRLSTAKKKQLYDECSWASQKVKLIKLYDKLDASRPRIESKERECR